MLFSKLGHFFTRRRKTRILSRVVKCEFSFLWSSFVLPFALSFSLSQVPDTGAVPGPGRLVDLVLELVVTELAVVLELDLDRKVLEESRSDLLVSFNVWLFPQGSVTWRMSFISALSVDILAFFMTETDGPTQVTKTNLALLLSSSPV